MSNSPSQETFVRRWGVLIAFGIFVFAVLAAFRFWTEHQAEQPVLPEYQGYLEYLANGSPRARLFFDAYMSYNASGVKSRDFERLCGLMTRAAEAEGVNPDRYSVHMANGCRQFGR